MPTDKRRVLWVVEQRVGKHWVPIASRVEYLRREALTAAANYKHWYPEVECRVRAYVPREEKGR